MTPITITRDQRDALHYEIRCYEFSEGPLGDFQDGIERAGRGFDARERWQHFTIVARLLDDLGWDRQGDRDSYTLTMDPATLRRWAGHRLEETEACLAEHARSMADVRAGIDPWGPPSQRRTMLGLENDLEDLRDLTNVELEVAGACRAILSQLEETS
jgi:hypothetical protein